MGTGDTKGEVADHYGCRALFGIVKRTVYVIDRICDTSISLAIYIKSAVIYVTIGEFVRLMV